MATHSFLSAATPMTPHGDSQISILMRNHSTLDSPGIPIILLPSSPELKPNTLDSSRVPFETHSVTSPNPLLATLSNANSTSDQPEANAGFHLSSSSLFSIADIPGLTPDPSSNSPASNGTSSLAFDRVRRHRHARMPGGPPLICAVCGDVATSFNFGIICCEGCKSFFRRNWRRINELVCLANGNCNIERGTRKYCPSCRLRICFAAGMKPDFITESQRRVPGVKDELVRRSSSETVHPSNDLEPRAKRDSVEQSDEDLSNIVPKKRRGRKARELVDMTRTITSAATTTNHASSSSSSSSSGGPQSDSVVAQVSTTSSAAPVFIKKLKRFWQNGEHADASQFATASACATSASESPPPPLATAHSAADLVLNPPDSVPLSDISISNLPSLSSPTLKNAMGNELPFDAPVSNSAFSSPSSRPDPQLRPVAQPASITPFVPTSSPGSSLSLCPTCHQMKPASACSTCVSTSDALAIPEVIVSTTIREPSAAQRQAGMNSVVVVESRRALTPGTNLLLPDSNSVSSSVKMPVGLIPDAQFEQIFNTINAAIRLITEPFSNEEAFAIREGLQSTSLHALTDILIRRTIRTFKLFPEFLVLSQEKQMRLLRADMFHILKASDRLFYDPKLCVQHLPVQNGPPIYIYLSELLKKFDRLGLPFCRLFAFHGVTYLEIFNVFDSDPMIIYMIFFLSLFSPHKFLSDGEFLTEVLPVHARYVQFLKQYILRRYANVHDRPLPPIDFHYLFWHECLQPNSPSLPDASASSASFPSSSTSSPNVASLPFAQRLVDFALRALDWFLIATSAPITKVSSRRMAEMQLLPPLLLEILELEGLRPVAPPAPAPTPFHS